MSVAGLIFAAAASVSGNGDTHLAAVESAIFGLCPKVLSGELDMASEAAAGQVGYRWAAPHPQRTNIETGEGETSSVIWGPKSPEDATPSCIVSFAAPAMNEMFDAIEASARAKGFDGGAASLASAKARQVRLNNAAAEY